MVEVMAHLGHRDFFLAGHDRGARVAHRLAIDPQRRFAGESAEQVVGAILKSLPVPA
jgi:pimeloyl-ACP methyl ester carboxylesterase